jgi:hypothetical protein
MAISAGLVLAISFHLITEIANFEIVKPVMPFTPRGFNQQEARKAPAG